MQHLVVEVHLGEAGNEAQHHLLDCRQRAGRDRDGVAVAAHPLRDPEDVNLVDAGPALRLASCSLLHCLPLHRQLLPAAIGSSSSRASTSNSSPDSTSRSSPPHAAHANGNSVTRLSAAQCRHATRAGTCSISSSAPSTGVPCATSSNANVSALGTTWRRYPILTSTFTTWRSAACSSAIATIASAIDSSCISRCAGADRRPADPSPASRRTPSPPKRARGAPS